MDSFINFEGGEILRPKPRGFMDTYLGSRLFGDRVDGQSGRLLGGRGFLTQRRGGKTVGNGFLLTLRPERGLGSPGETTSA